MKALFDSFDADSNGKVSCKELIVTLNILKKNL